MEVSGVAHQRLDEDFQDIEKRAGDPRWTCHDPYLI
jgi:hypothetical protein